MNQVNAGKLSVMNPWISYIGVSARLIMAGVFIYASYDKIMNPAAFAEAVFSYQILPSQLINITALVLPWLEFFLGILLLAGIWLPGASLGISLLMTIFIGALLYNLARGLDFYCGCFSTAPTGTGVSWLIVVRDIWFLILSLYLFFYHFFLNRKKAFSSSWH